MQMISFLGNIEAKTDDKGRIFLPAIFRKQLLEAGQTSLVLRKDVHQDCLVLYPQNVWQDIKDQLRSRLNLWDKRQQNIFRQFVCDAEPLTLDATGRILIPKRYLDMAHIKGNVRFIGMDETIELWSKPLSDEPFLTPEEFSQALQETLGNNDKD